VERNPQSVYQSRRQTSSSETRTLVKDKCKEREKNGKMPQMQGGKFLPVKKEDVKKKRGGIDYRAAQRRVQKKKKGKKMELKQPRLQTLTEK